MEINSFVAVVVVATVMSLTGWSKKTAQLYGTIILQPHVIESCSFQQNVRKEINMTGVHV